MALQLYRRHRKECEGSHAEDSKSGQFEEGRRGWKRCACLIHASGTLGGKFKRRSTEKWKWEEAIPIAAAWDSSGTWEPGRSSAHPQDPDESSPVPEQPANSELSKAETDHSAAQVAHPERMTVDAATKAYLSKCENRGITLSTLGKYKTMTNQLVSFCARKGYIYPDQLRVVDMDEFYGEWKDGKKGKAKKLERLRSFVRFCLKRKLLAENIVEDLEAPPNASERNQKSPFEDEELERIYTACNKIGQPTQPGPGYRTWGGEDVRDFINVSVYTGLRISDVALFDSVKRLEGNDVFLCMHKTGKPLYTWIPDWLVARLRAREKKYGPLIFNCGVTGNAKQLCDIWRNKRLKRVFELAGPFDEKPTPHRFRHTFARILLERGVPIPDVAELIGDTEEVVRKYYAKWIKGRQVRLSRILQKAFEGMPELNILATGTAVDIEAGGMTVSGELQDAL